MSNAHNVAEIVLLTKQQVCELEECTPRFAEMQASSGAWRTQQSESRGRNGKCERKYFLDSLSAEAQVRHAGSGVRATAIVPAETLPLFASAHAWEEKAAVERVSIPEKLRAQVDQRFQAIRPLLEFRSTKKAERRKISLPGGRFVSTMRDLAGYVAAQQHPPVTSRTLFRWLDRWDEALKKGANGYAALAESPRSDAKGPGSRSITPIAQAYIQKKYLDRDEGQLWMWTAWQALARDWSTVLGEKGQPPSYATVRKYLNNKVSAGLKTLARVGPEAYLSRCAPFIIRGRQPVMKTWISDHRVHDVHVQNIWFAKKQQELHEAYRVWLTAIFDMGSQAIVGYCYSPQPNWTTIHSALRMAVMQYGFPQYLYWDNGEDFKKAKRHLEAIQVSNEVLGFNFQVVSALPKRPRSKPIEAYFTRFSKTFDPMWGDAYLGNDPKKRREFARLAEYRHNRFLEGKAENTSLPTDAQFIRTAVQFIEEYNNTKNKQIGWRTPNEVMEEACPERNRPKINPRALDILLWEPTVRTVDRGGCVKMDGMWYEPTEHYLYTMANLQHHKILILRDPYNLGDAVAVTENRAFIAELRLKEFVDQDPANPITRAEIQSYMKEERRLKKMNTEHLALLGLISRRCGWKTECELLQERAGVLVERTGTDDARALPSSGVPGAARRLPAPRAVPASRPAFVSDAVAEDEDFWKSHPVEV